MTDLFVDIGWLEFQSNIFSICRVSLHCGVGSMGGVRGAFSVQKRNTSCQDIP